MKAPKLTLLSKEQLNSAFIAALGDAAEMVGDPAGFPLMVRVDGIVPYLCRAYLYNATNPPGGRPGGPASEHKVNLIAPGQARDARDNFDFGDDARVVLAGYNDDLDVFVLWDSSLHRDFSYSANLQVKSSVLEAANEDGEIHEAIRRLRLGGERVLVLPARRLTEALERRFPAGAPPLMPMPNIAPTVDPVAGLPTAGGGRTYTSPVRQPASAVAKALVFEVDPEMLDRATAAHMVLQDGLADVVRTHGFEPLSPLADDPQFDLAWRDGEVAYLVEVKSLTAANEERQLRLGLGQLLTYMFLANWDGVSAVRGVLAVEYEPSGEHWTEMCASLDIALVWPDTFTGLFEPPET